MLTIVKRYRWRLAALIPLFSIVFSGDLAPVLADSGGQQWGMHGKGRHESSAGEQKYKSRAAKIQAQQDYKANSDHNGKSSESRKKHFTGEDKSHKQDHPKYRSPKSNTPPAIWQEKKAISKPAHQSGVKHTKDWKTHNHKHIKKPPRYWEGKPHRHDYARTPWYFTRHLAPIHRHHHHVHKVVKVLPKRHIRIVIRDVHYYYYSGVYYRPHKHGYVVVYAPLGAVIRALPIGFIAFTTGLTTYYYLNDVFYTWDPEQDGYVVVAKPKDADKAIAEATEGRLVVYPNQDQDEEQQAKDRYECHRWAVNESGIDPTVDDTEFTTEQNQHYRRAISACLEGRDYTVK